MREGEGRKFGRSEEMREVMGEAGEERNGWRELKGRE